MIASTCSFEREPSTITYLDLKRTSTPEPMSPRGWPATAEALPATVGRASNERTSGSPDVPLWGQAEPIGRRQTEVGREADRERGGKAEGGARVYMDDEGEPS